MNEDNLLKHGLILYTLSFLETPDIKDELMDYLSESFHKQGAYTDKSFSEIKEKIKPYLARIRLEIASKSIQEVFNET